LHAQDSGSGGGVKDKARVLMLGTALEGRGGVAAVVSVLRDGGLFERERVRYVPTHAEGSRGGKIARALAGFWHAGRICLCQRPAIVHVHSASSASFLRKSLLLLMARSAGCKTIFHLHGGGFREFATIDSGPLMRRWIRHTLEKSSRVIALSDNWAQFVRGVAPRARVAVLPNSVPLPVAAGGREEPGRVLFLGRIEQAKGVFDLLEAIARLVPRFPPVRVSLAGVGDAQAVRRRAAELGIAGHIELPGWLGEEERRAALERAEVFCLPSHAEGLPMALLEAMAAGKAVVATRVGAIPEAVLDGENGLLVPAQDSAALAIALERVLADAALRLRLGKQARATVEQHFSLDAVGATLAGIYHELEAN
jgi:glycosyltransferase involved in cell wall biosynthesis